MNAPMDYAGLLDLAIGTEPAHTVWSVSDLEKLTLDQIQLVATARASEFEEKFSEVVGECLTGAGTLDLLVNKPVIVLQAALLAPVELAARLVLFEEAVEEAGRREYDANFGEADERGEEAYQRAKGETL